MPTSSVLCTFWCLWFMTLNFCTSFNVELRLLNLLLTFFAHKSIPVLPYLLIMVSFTGFVHVLQSWKITENWQIQFQDWKSYGKMKFWSDGLEFCFEHQHISKSSTLAQDFNYWGERIGVNPKIWPKNPNVFKNVKATSQGHAELRW